MDVMEFCIGLAFVFIIVVLIVGIAENYSQHYVVSNDVVIFKEYDRHLAGKVIVTDYYIYTKDCYKFLVSEEFYNNAKMGDIVVVCKSKETGDIFINTTNYGSFQRC